MIFAIDYVCILSGLMNYDKRNIGNLPIGNAQKQTVLFILMKFFENKIDKMLFLYVI